MTVAKKRSKPGPSVMYRVVEADTPADDIAYYAIAVDDVKTLCNGLKEAYGQFLNGEDGGRAGVIKALGWVIAFLSKLEPLAEERGLVPLKVLAGALGGLDHHSVQPLLTPSRPDNRPQGAGLRVMVKAMAVYIVTVLTASGAKPKDAYKDVAEVLNKDEIKSLGSKDPINAKTVQNWKKKISAGTDKELSRVFWEIKNSELDELRRKMPRKGLGIVMLMGFGFFISLYRAEDAR